MLDRRKKGLFIYGGWVSLHPAKERHRSKHQVEKPLSHRCRTCVGGHCLWRQLVCDVQLGMA